MTRPELILILGAFAALAAANLWLAAVRGRILGRYGFVARRDDPVNFWIDTLVCSVGASLFLLLFLTFLDPRDFQPVLRWIACENKAWSWACFAAR
jgi:hypothetical protein